MLGGKEVERWEAAVPVLSCSTITEKVSQSAPWGVPSRLVSAEDTQQLGLRCLNLSESGMMQNQRYGVYVNAYCSTGCSIPLLVQHT